MQNLKLVVRNVNVYGSSFRVLSSIKVVVFKAHISDIIMHFIQLLSFSCPVDF